MAGEAVKVFWVSFDSDGDVAGATMHEDTAEQWRAIGRNVLRVDPHRIAGPFGEGQGWLPIEQIDKQNHNLMWLLPKKGIPALGLWNIDKKCWEQRCPDTGHEIKDVTHYFSITYPPIPQPSPQEPDLVAELRALDSKLEQRQIESVGRVAHDVIAELRQDLWRFIPRLKAAP